MLDIAISYVAIFIFTLFCAGHDGTSYLLKEQHEEHPLALKRVDRWHRDGSVIWSMFLFAVAWKTMLWQIIVIGLLIRLAIFDMAFNKWAQIPLDYLGSTAKLDKIFSQIFGKNGAKKKLIVFLILSIIFTLWALKWAS